MSAVPTPYTRQANFVSDAGNNPSGSASPVKLDAEFNAVQTAISTTQSRLAQIQRDDGGLLNGIVDRNALAPNMVFSGADIQLGSVTGYNLASKTVTADNIADGTIDPTKLTSGFALPASAIPNGSISDAQVSSLSTRKITGLDAALNGKQPAGSYAALVHQHSLSDITQSSASSGQVPTWNGTAWVPSTPPTAAVLSVANKTGTVILTANDISGLGTAATQNSTAFDASGAATTAQAYAVQRANHTGTQPASTITGLAPIATSGAYTDLTGKPTLATVATSGAYTDLTGKPTIPAAQVNSDWNAASGLAQILNKPTIPAAQVNSDWDASTGVSQILNKPTLATVATSGSYADLSNKPTLGTASPLDVAASGNASTLQVVKGNDTRLSDARTPTAHTHPLSDLTQSAATTGQVPTWNGTAWAPATPSAGGVTSVAGRTGAVTLSTGDISGLVVPSKICDVYQNSAQSFPGNTTTTVKFDTKLSDPNSLFNTTNWTFTVPATGLYIIYCAFQASGGTKGTSSCDVKLVGTTLGTVSFNNGSTYAAVDTSLRMTSLVAVSLTVSDPIIVQTYQTQTVNAYTGAPYMRLTVYRIA